MIGESLVVLAMRKVALSGVNMLVAVLWQLPREHCIFAACSRVSFLHRLRADMATKTFQGLPSQYWRMIFWGRVSSMLISRLRTKE
jgi:hypothetical protein